MIQQLSPILLVVLGAAFVEHATADLALDYGNRLVGKEITVEDLDNAAVLSAATHGGGTVEIQVWGDTEDKAYLHSVLITVSVNGKGEVTNQIKCLRSKNGQEVKSDQGQKVKELCDKVLKGLQDAKEIKTAELKPAAVHTYRVPNDPASIAKLLNAIRPTTPTAGQLTFKQLTIGKVTWSVVGAAASMDKRFTGNVRVLLFVAKAEVKSKPASMLILVQPAGNDAYTVKFALYALNGSEAAYSDVVTDTTINSNEVMNAKIAAALKTAANAN